MAVRNVCVVQRDATKMRAAGDIGRQLTKHGMRTHLLLDARRAGGLLLDNSPSTKYIEPQHDALMASCSTQSLPLLQFSKTIVTITICDCTSLILCPSEPTLDHSLEQS